MEQSTESIPKKLTLHEIHAANGAKFLEVEGWMLPTYFTDPATENLAVRNHVGIIDLSYKGYLKIGGSDRASFLQGIITNDVGDIKLGDGIHAAILTIKGRIIADFILLAFAEAFILETEASVSEKLRTTLSRYKIREKVAIEQSYEIGSIAVQGPKSPHLIKKITGKPLPELKTYNHTQIQLHEDWVTIRKQSITGETGYILTTSQTALQEIWEKLLKAGIEFSLQPVGYEASESLRIEAGLPRYGFDLSEENIPLEIEKEDMISFTKGCYVGQEVVARLKFLGQANKHLKGLLLASEAIPTHNSRITQDQKEFGRVTSSTYSPSLKQPIALAYLRREYCTPGTQVMVESNGREFPATVADLPFIKR